MTFTRRFGFWKFGGQAGGTIADQGNQFSLRDRDAMDAILAALETHAHTGGTALVNPSTAPTASTSTTGGSLPAGTTQYYVVSYVDQFGLETAASPEIAVAMPAPVPAPNAPALTPNAAGSLQPGTYYYGLTFGQNGDTLETELSPLSVITLVPGQGSVTVQLPALPAGAEGVSVYRKGPNDADLYRLVDDVSGQSQITDDGTAYTISSTPSPTYNSTNSANTATITVPDTALVGEANSPVAAWRLYRAESSGAYGSSALVEHVVQTNSQTGGTLVTSWTDTGTALLDGTPQSVSGTLKPSALLSSGANQGVTTVTKDADASTSSTVLVADPVLSTGVSSGATYEVEATVFVQSAAGGALDLELRVVTGNAAIVTGAPAAVSGTWAVVNVAGAVVTGYASSVRVTPASASPVALRLTGILDATQAGGQLFLAYASPGGGGLTVQQYSFLKVRRL